MELSAEALREWLKVWPCEFRKKFQVNYGGRFYTNKAHRYNIFYNTEWKELDLEIRGNCLFGYEVEPRMGTECGPAMGWLLEHVDFKLGIPTHLLTLPEGLNLRHLDDSAIVYFHEKDDPDQSFLAIFCPCKEDTNDLFGRLKQCSLSFLKSCLGRSLSTVQPASLALHEKAEISTNIALNRLESLKYEHDFLKQQQESLKLDNTLLATQSSVNSQLYSESIQLQLRENSHLKNELERALKEIDLRDATIKTLNKRITTIRQDVAQNQHTVHELRKELESTNRALDEATLVPDKRLRVMYAKKLRQASNLSLKLLSSEFDKSKLIARYHSLKGDMNTELAKIHDLVESDEIYQLLKLWVLCNELKVEYYENMPDLNYDERNRLLDKIERTQFELNIAMTIARATYITYRTMIFDGVLNSFVDNKFKTFKASHDLMNVAFEKLSWIFHPDPRPADSSDPVWVNNVKMTKLVEKTLYNNSASVWYNRVSFASAVRPVVRYDQDGRDELEIKKRLYYCLDQNNQLRQKIKSMSRQIGSDAHWRSMWQRTSLKKKTPVSK